MNLVIARVAARVLLPARLRGSAPMVNRVARDALEQACVRELATRWPSQTAICRIRRLYVRVEVSPRELNEAALAAAWAAAFCRVLLQALNQPVGRIEAVESDSVAEWTATFLLDVMNGTAASHWAYEEFAEYIGIPAADAILGVLERALGEVPQTLLALAERDGLTRMLAILGDGRCETLCATIARNVTASPKANSVDDLLAIGRLATRAAGAASERGPLATSARALALYVAQLRGGAALHALAYSPIQILAGLRTLALLLIRGELWERSDWPAPVDAEIAKLRPDLTVETVQRELLISLRDRGSASSEVRSELARELHEVLQPLRSMLPASAPTKPENANARWVESECAGLFLLVGSIIRLGWPDRVQSSPLGAEHGTRALTYVLAGVGLSLLGRGSAVVDRLDPGLALFAGWIEQPHLAGLAGFLAGTSSDRRLELLRCLDRDLDVAESAAESWDATFKYLAERLVRAFADRIRGFRKASHAFIVERFLAVPGRIGVEEKRLIVELSPNSLWVALHVSGGAEPLDAVSWLGGRRVELRLEGL